jgi:hypothetical protein
MAVLEHCIKNGRKCQYDDADYDCPTCLSCGEGKNYKDPGPHWRKYWAKDARSKQCKCHTCVNSDTLIIDSPCKECYQYDLWEGRKEGEGKRRTVVMVSKIFLVKELVNDIVIGDRLNTPLMDSKGRELRLRGLNLVDGLVDIESISLPRQGMKASHLVSFLLGKYTSEGKVELRVDGESIVDIQVENGYLWLKKAHKHIWKYILNDTVQCTSCGKHINLELLEEAVHRDSVGEGVREDYQKALGMLYDIFEVLGRGK